MHSPVAGELGRLEGAFGPHCIAFSPGLPGELMPRTTVRVEAQPQGCHDRSWSMVQLVWDGIGKPVAFRTVLRNSSDSRLSSSPYICSPCLKQCDWLDLPCTQTLSHEELQCQATQLPPSGSQYHSRAEVMSSFGSCTVSSTIRSFPTWHLNLWLLGVEENGLWAATLLCVLELMINLSELRLY